MIRDLIDNGIPGLSKPKTLFLIDIVWMLFNIKGFPD